MLMLDFWKDIKDYENLYSVSYCGCARSWNKYMNGRCRNLSFKKGRVLRPDVTRQGYLRVQLCNGDGCFRKTVHRLVAETFIPNPNNYPQVNHKNGIKSDNRVENLEWCNQQQNIIHSRDNGLQKFKLSVESAMDIKRLLRQGWLQKDIAKKYNVDRTTICDINIGRTWKEVV